MSSFVNGADSVMIRAFAARSTGLADAPRRRSALPWGRWLGVALLSLLLHAAALHWAGDRFRLAAPAAKAPPVMQSVLVQLQAPPQVVPVRVAAPAKPRPKPAARPRKPPSPPRTPAADAILQPAAMTATAAASTAVADSDVPADAGIHASDLASIPDGIEMIAAQEAPAAATPVVTVAAEAVRLDPPPPASLKYNVAARRDGQEVYGHGTITWRTDGSRYFINGDAGILFISALEFSSQGQIDAAGIAPLLYSEKRFRRPPTDTRFDRERAQIGFSASAASYPLQGGEQDRASIVWQLAGIGRGDPARFAAGAQIPLFVAGTRDAYIWNIEILGEEDIEVDLGATRAWHVRRAPRPGARDDAIDIWLAPAQHWYPVKLRYTEANGEYLELSLKRIDVPGDE